MPVPPLPPLPPQLWRWPSPLIDEGRRIDPLGPARRDGDDVVWTTAAGTEVRGRLTGTPDGGVRLRLTVPGAGGSTAAPLPTDGPLLVDFAEQSLPDGAVELTADGRLSFGAWRMSASIPVFGAGDVRSGLSVDAVTGDVLGIVLAWDLAPDAGVFGGGEAYQGPDLRGRIRRLVNAELHGIEGGDLTYLNVPFFWSDAGWGIAAHTGAPTRADLGCTSVAAAALGIEGTEADVFLFAGDGPTILRQYHAVSGLPGRFPEWALGVWGSRCSYVSEAEMQAALDGYEQAECPVDVVHVDAWLAGNVIADLACNWTVHRERFPEGWGKRIHDRGVRLSIWHNPYLLEGAPVTDDAVEKGYVLKGAADEGPGRFARTADKLDRLLVDFTNPDAVEWWKGHVRRVATEEGVDSFKPDFAEEPPLDSRTFDGRRGWDVRNEYAVRYQAATHAALSEVMAERGEGDAGVALFGRSGTVGAHRYPCHWVGDTPSTWAGLEAAVRSCLSLSMSGFAFVASDVGGFFTPDSVKGTISALADGDSSFMTADVDPELFTRWAQWSAFCGAMRFHGAGRREPWAYPGEFGAASVEACRWRDRLRGYLTALAEEAATVGTPLMRPMALAHPGDRAARAATTQHMLGADVLVAPVLQPGGRVDVWVPPGEWEPICGLSPVSGPGWVTVDVPIDAFPAWRRAGTDPMPEAP